MDRQSDRSAVEVYSEPIAVGQTAYYRLHIDCAEADHVPLVIDGQEIARIAVSDLLP